MIYNLIITKKKTKKTNISYLVVSGVMNLNGDFDFASLYGRICVDGGGDARDMVAAWW